MINGKRERHSFKDALIDRMRRLKNKMKSTQMQYCCFHVSSKFGGTAKDWMYMCGSIIELMDRGMELSMMLRRAAEDKEPSGVSSLKGHVRQYSLSFSNYVHVCVFKLMYVTIREPAWADAQQNTLYEGIFLHLGCNLVVVLHSSLQQLQNSLLHLDIFLSGINPSFLRHPYPQLVCHMALRIHRDRDLCNMEKSSGISLVEP